MPSARALTLSLPAVLLAACAHAPSGPSQVLDRAAAAAAAPDAPARTHALAGFQSLLIDGQPDEAARRFARALAQDPSEPFALTGTALLADRAAHPEAVLAAALELCLRAPTHPLAPLAARTVAVLAGKAAGMDALILARVPEILSRPAPGDTAFHLRVALGTLQAHRDPAAAAAVRADAGLVPAVSLVGPLAPLRGLSFDTPTGPERTGELGATVPGPLGAMPVRVIPSPEGELSLASEGPLGDVYLAAFDVEVTSEATYVVRTAGTGPYRMVVDGTALYVRRPVGPPTALTSEQAVLLAAGRHRLMVVVLRGERVNSVALAVFRADGQAAGLRFSPASGPAAWTGARTAAAPALLPTAASVREALLSEAGDTLATYLAVRDAEGRDRDGARRLLTALAPPATPAWTALQASVAMGDLTLPPKVTRGRAAQLLEATVAKDPGDVDSQLRRAALALDDQRTAQASEATRAARAAHTPVGYPVELMSARLALVLGLDAQGDIFALQALKSVDGVCAALGLRYDLAMRRDAVADADRLLGQLRTCPGEEGRAVEHAKVRGRLAEAAELAQVRLATEPASVALAQAAAALLLSVKRPAEGVALLQRMHTLWPHDANVLKHLADLQTLAGDARGALASREEALLLDGSDLTLRRMVERVRTGKELLADQAVNGKAALRAYESGPRDDDAPSVLVLDAAATRAYPDGSTVDRIHTIQKVLDQGGIQEVAEVTLPPGAQLLALRTLKADGKVLEPETIEGKETISMPGVGVGDAVEQEFLLAHGARGPAVPGWTAAAFYFQVAQVPDHWATYTVLGPRGGGMAVDAHNMTASPVETRGDLEVYRQDVRRSPAFIPEPETPPAANELLPLVLVGAGARGQEALLTAVADAALERLRPNAEVEAFARGATRGRTGVEAVRSLYAAVHARIPGRDAGLALSAAATVALDRGSRLALLKASLEAVGIAARLAAVRTFSVDPAPYVFPGEGLFPYLCLRVEVPGSPPLWLDTLVRFGPFAELPEQAAGGREAYLLPEPGHPLERIVTPAGKPPAGKEVTLELVLAADGTLTGKASDVYRGFEGAQLAEALDALSQEERLQALQSALGGNFGGGAELADIRVDAPRTVGAPVTVRYAFRAQRFARVEGQRMVLGPLTYPTFLGRRYVQVARRRMPLFVDGTEATRSQVTLTLPAGWVMEQPLPEAKLEGPFGTFARAERQVGSRMEVQESYFLKMARIPVSRYEEFAQFAGEVDLLQSRDVVLGKRGAQPTTASAGGARGSDR